MVRRNARLVSTTEKGGLATPLWTDSEFKSFLGVSQIGFDKEIWYSPRKSMVY